MKLEQALVTELKQALMAELVDAPDSKSGAFMACRFKSGSGYQNRLQVQLTCIEHGS